MAGISGGRVGAVVGYSAAVVAVGTSAAALHTPAASAGEVVTVRPMDGTVYLGGSGVTVAQGFPVNAGESFELRPSGAAVYAIASAAVNVRKLVEVVG